MLEIFTRAFFVKNNYWNSGSFKCYKELLLEMKKESPKRCEPPQNNQNSSSDTRKTRKRGEEMKNEKYKKSLTT